MLENITVIFNRVSWTVGNAVLSILAGVFIPMEKLPAGNDRRVYTQARGLQRRTN
jgi:hypothetical protein